jgi:hypothetical protein
MGIGGAGCIVLSLSCLGYWSIALWSWKIVSALYFAIMVFVAITTKLTRWTRVGMVANMTLAIFFLLASLGATRFFGNGQPAAAPLSTIMTRYSIDGVAVWHGIALTILAIATLVFLFLFVRMIERGIAPQIETSWGGLGGGLGGWRISSSLTYLTMAAMFGVLFAYFVMQLGEAPDKADKATAPPVGQSRATSTAPK